MGDLDPVARVSPVEPLPETLVRDLKNPRAHPEDPAAKDGIEWVQTHLSHVFLSPARAVKIRKAVDLGFVDFGARDARNRDCVHELLLNRRLAPDIYLGIAPLVHGATGWQLGPVGDALSGDREHAVVMRRLPDGADALARLRAGRLADRELEAAAEVLASFHASHPLAGEATTPSWRERVDAPMQASIGSLRQSGVVSNDSIDTVESGWRRVLDLRRHEFDRRATRLVDGHGDVRLEHVWFETDAGPPIFIDCVEFDPALRQIDPASEVAFLAMDLRHRNRADLAEHFLASYAAASDDFGLYSVVDPYIAYRATVRAKVAALAVLDSGIDPAQRSAAAATANAYLDLAREALRPEEPGRVVAVCGTVGTGKSTAARRLARALGDGVVVSTDRVRKQVSAAGDEDRYAPANVERVYEAILERAEAPVRTGRTVILDATFSRRSSRSHAAAWARASGSEAWLVHVDCPREIARERLRLRKARGDDASEAGPERLEASRAAFEAPTDWPEAHRIELDSTDPDRFASAIEGATERIRQGDGHKTSRG